MTAYRYVRTGRLPARSVGGVWSLERDEVTAFAQRHERGPVVRGRSPARTAMMFEDRVVEGDEAGALGVCEAALGSWATPVDVYMDILVPALRSIGERWHTGELTVADEHRAANVATRVTGRLGPRFLRRGRRLGTMVIGAVGGDQHGLPVAVVGDLLRFEGFSVVDLGADTPAAAFVDAAQTADRLLAVAIGSTLQRNLAAVTEAVEAVGDSLPSTPVIVGGAGVPTAAAARKTGADHWSGTDGRTLVGLALNAAGLAVG